jgi:hypothetical protein
MFFGKESICIVSIDCWICDCAFATEKKKKKKKKKNRRTFEKSFFFFFVFTHLHSLEIKDARNCACSSWPMWQSNRRQGEC